MLLAVVALYWLAYKEIYINGLIDSVRHLSFGHGTKIIIEEHVSLSPTTSGPHCTSFAESELCCYCFSSERRFVYSLLQQNSFVSMLDWHLFAKTPLLWMLDCLATALLQKDNI